MAHDIAGECHFETQKGMALGKSRDGQQKEEGNPQGLAYTLEADW